MPFAYWCPLSLYTNTTYAAGGCLVRHRRSQEQSGMPLCACRRTLSMRGRPGHVHAMSGPACIQGAHRRTCSTWRHGRGGMRSNIAAKRRVQGSGLAGRSATSATVSAILRSHAPVLVRGSHGISDKVPQSVVTVFAYL